MRTQLHRLPSMPVLAAAAGLALLPGILRAGSVASPVPVTFGPDLELTAAQPATVQHVEPTIAANPLDPKNLVAGFFSLPAQGTDTQPCFVVTTTDAGATWSPTGTVPLASDFDECFDPSLTADASGTFYYAYLDVHVTQPKALTTRSRPDPPTELPFGRRGLPLSAARTRR